MWAVIKKELKSYFTTPIGYIFIGVFLIAFSVSFYFTVLGYGSVNFERIFCSLPTILVLAFLIPLLTMRSFSEERKTGTEQLLITSPLSITKITLGKFFAASIIVIFIAVRILLIVVSLFASQITKLPIIKQVDEIGGIAYGAVEGIVIVYIILSIISLTGVIWSDNMLVTTVTKSALGSMMYNNNIILKFLFK